LDVGDGLLKQMVMRRDGKDRRGFVDQGNRTLEGDGRSGPFRNKIIGRLEEALVIPLGC
jgi:hypothetical protein